MGVGLFVMFEPKISGANTFSTGTDGKCLAAALPLLDEICLDKGVTPFTRFIPDFDELAELAMESPEAASLVETMFDPGDALKIVSRLIKTMQAEDKWARGRTKRESEGVVTSLQLLQTDLKVARRKKARFCLSFY
jgi:hypothetical protein